MPIVTLSAISSKNIKNKYKVIVDVMHGDADFYEKVEIICKDEADFVKKMLATKSQPLDGSAGGDEDKYTEWLEENFGGSIPYDKKFSCTGNHAKVEDVHGFYYDLHGLKFKAEVTT